MTLAAKEKPNPTCKIQSKKEPRGRKPADSSGTKENRRSLHQVCLLQAAHSHIKQRNLPPYERKASILNGFLDYKASLARPLIAHRDVDAGLLSLQYVGGKQRGRTCESLCAGTFCSRDPKASNGNNKITRLNAAGSLGIQVSS